MKQISHLFEAYNDKTCPIYRDKNLVFSSHAKGVKPLLDYYREHGSSELPLRIAELMASKS